MKRRKANTKVIPAAAKQLNAEIGRRVRIARNRVGCRLEDMAAHLGRSSPAVSKRENGQTMISAADLAAIASYFNITIRSLFPKGSVR